MCFLRPLIVLLTLLATPARSEGLCDGKYALAAEMLDAAYVRYGSLYAGGHSYSWYDIGPTLDLWRLWRGLPDLRLRDPSGFETHSDWGADFGHFGRTPEDIALLLRIAERPSATGLSPLYHHVTVRWLHQLIRGYYRDPAGWWLNPDPKAAKDSRPDRAQVYNVEIIAKLLPTEPLLEWLLFTHDVTLSPGSAVWSREDAFPPSDVENDRLTQAALARFEEDPGLEWFVVASLYDPTHVQTRAKLLARDVVSCKAGPAEYAAYAIWVFQDRRAHRSDPGIDMLAYLPPEMRVRAIENLAALAIDPNVKHGRYDPQFGSKVLALLAEWVPRHDVLSWLNIARTRTASTIDELITVHRGIALDGRAVRSLNLLSYHDLRRLAAEAELSQDDRMIVLNALAGRAFVFRELADARVYRQEIAVRLPESEAAIRGALASEVTEEVRIANALMALADPSVGMRSPRLFYREDDNVALNARWSKSRMDLPEEFLLGTFLTRDLRAWFLEPGSNGRQPGYYTNPTFRQVDHGVRYFGRAGLDFLSARPREVSNFAFARLIDWEEVRQLGVCHGLSKRLAEVIITWVDEGTNGWIDHWFAPREEMADALRRVILMGRHNSGALVNGQPAGQVAMRLLQDRFGDTEAAKKTKYWYFEDHGCKP